LEARCSRGVSSLLHFAPGQVPVEMGTASIGGIAIETALPEMALWLREIALIYLNGQLFAS
jgi:hypothetical protein